MIGVTYHMDQYKHLTIAKFLDIVGVSPFPEEAEEIAA